MLNVAFSELKMKKGKVVLTNRGSILPKVIISLKRKKMARLRKSPPN